MAKKNKKNYKNKNPSTDKRNQDYIGIWADGHASILPGYTPIAKVSEVRQCIHVIADLVSSMTIMLMENGEKGDRRIKNELSKRIDINPNKMMTRKQFIYKIVCDLCISGNAVVLPLYKDVYLDNMMILNEDSVTYQAAGESYCIWYHGQKFYPDEVMHFVLIPDDAYPFKGRGYTDIIKDQVTSLIQEKATKDSFLKSKWKPSVIISIDSDIDDLADGAKRKNILSSYANDTEQGEPWIIPAGELDIKTIRPLTLNDLAIKDSIVLDKKALAAAIGVPSFMVGIGEYNKEEYNNFVSRVVMSFATILQQEMTRKLIYKDEWYLKMNIKSLMQYDINELTAFTSELVKMGSLNRNEQRSYFDLEPKEGLDEYAVLENFIPVGDIAKQKKLNQEGGAANGE